MPGRALAAAGKVNSSQKWSPCAERRERADGENESDEDVARRTDRDFFVNLLICSEALILGVLAVILTRDCARIAMTR